MGFNISGIAVNQDFDKDVLKVAAAFNWDIENIQEIGFESASANWTPEEDVNICFADHATLIFLNFDKCLSGFGLAEAKVLTFAYSETSMAFLLNLWDENKTTRFIMEVNGETLKQKGEKLPLEVDGITTDELIFKLIEQVLGRSFFDMDDEPAFHCKFST